MYFIYQESLLNGRIEPSGIVDGFTAEIGASGSFCPKHVSLPVTAFFFNLSDDNAPSPYLVCVMKYNQIRTQSLNGIRQSCLPDHIKQQLVCVGLTLWGPMVNAVFC